MSKLKLYFATTNEHKRDEMLRVIESADIVLPKDEGITFEADENGKSFIENALIKAEELYKIVKKPCLSDDSGLVVDALDNLMGIHTSRFGDTKERKLTQKEKNTLLLKTLENEKNRKARFVCALVLIISEGEKYIIQESFEGEIAYKESGENGFGYDPIFIVQGVNKTASELSGAEKDLLSHRGKAVRKMNLLIKEIINEKK